MIQKIPACILNEGSMCYQVITALVGTCANLLCWLKIEKNGVPNHNKDQAIEHNTVK